MRERSDNDLMKRYAAGDDVAFGEIFQRHESRAYRYFLRRAGSEAHAWDLYQELFLKLHRFRGSYDTAKPFEPWFYQIAHSVLVDAWRQELRRAEVGLDERVLASPGVDAECTAANREEAAQMLDALSPEHARILVDAKVWGLEHGEIAAALAKSIDAVKQTASRSLRRLRAAHALAR